MVEEAMRRETLRRPGRSRSCTVECTTIDRTGYTSKSHRVSSPARMWRDGNEQREDLEILKKILEQERKRAEGRKTPSPSPTRTPTAGDCRSLNSANGVIGDENGEKGVPFHRTTLKRYVSKEGLLLASQRTLSDSNVSACGSSPSHNLSGIGSRKSDKADKLEKSEDDETNYCYYNNDDLLEKTTLLFEYADSCDNDNNSRQVSELLELNGKGIKANTAPFVNASLMPQKNNKQENNHMSPNEKVVDNNIKWTEQRLPLQQQQQHESQQTLQLQEQQNQQKQEDQIQLLSEQLNDNVDPHVYTPFIGLPSSSLMKSPTFSQESSHTDPFSLTSSPSASSLPPNNSQAPSSSSFS